MGTPPLEGTPLTLPPPPRALPPGLVRRLRYGSVAAAIGWLLLLAGSVFAAIATPRVDLGLTTYDRWTTGTLRAAAATTTIEDGQAVWALAYVFRDERGVERAAVAYTASQDVARAIGAEVPIEYAAGRPARSRIVGTRTSMVPGYVGLLPLIPIGVGLTVVISMLITGSRQLRLLRDGVEVRAALVDRRRTDTRVNGEYVIALTFAYRAAPGGEEHRRVVHTTTPRRLEDEPAERLLYDPRRPARAFLLDELPGIARLGADGQLAPPPYRGWILRGVPPLVLAAWGALVVQLLS